MMRLIRYLEAEPDVKAEIIHHFTAEQLTGAFPADRLPPTGDEQCLASFVDGKMVAFMTFYEPEGHPNLYWVDLLWVAPAFRRRGIATELIGSLETIARVKNKVPVTIKFGTMTSNTAMQQVAGAAGYEPIGIQYGRTVP